MGMILLSLSIICSRIAGQCDVKRRLRRDVCCDSPMASTNRRSVYKFSTRLDGLSLHLAGKAGRLLQSRWVEISRLVQQNLVAHASL